MKSQRCLESDVFVGLSSLSLGRGLETPNPKFRAEAFRVDDSVMKLWRASWVCWTLAYDRRSGELLHLEARGTLIVVGRTLSRLIHTCNWADPTYSSFSDPRTMSR